MRKSFQYTPKKPNFQCLASEAVQLFLLNFDTTIRKRF